MKTFDPIIERCDDCQKVYLVEKKHKCQEFADIPYDKIIDAIAETLENEKLKPSEICSILNKSTGRLQFTHFYIKYQMDHMLDIFSNDEEGYYFLKKMELAA